MFFSISPSHAAEATLRPSKAEISAVFTSEDWRDSEAAFTAEDFIRLDESPDALFYSAPRFVEHIDAPAVKALTDFHTKQIKALSRDVYRDESGRVSVLDLCSSWVSHLPPSYNGNTEKEGSSDRHIEVVGVGMNEEELRVNPQLTRYIVQDLNQKPILASFEDRSFDIVLLQLSIDYLTHPIDVLSEAGRILRPGGKVLISFSNRVFIDKAVAGWTGKADIDHIETVGAYLKATKRFQEPLEAVDLSPSRDSDPLYVVIGTTST